MVRRCGKQKQVHIQETLVTSFHQYQETRKEENAGLRPWSNQKCEASFRKVTSLHPKTLKPRLIQLPLLFQKDRQVSIHDSILIQQLQKEKNLGPNALVKRPRRSPLSIQRPQPSLSQLPLLPQEVRQVVHGLKRVRMIRTEVRFAPCKSSAVQGLRLASRDGTGGVGP